MVVRVPTATPMPGRRRLIIIVVVVLAALLLAFTALSGFFVDILWFREVRLSDVFWTVLRTKVFASAIATVLGEVIAVLASATGMDAEKAWHRVAVVARGIEGPDTAAIFAPTLPLKATTAMRLADDAVADIWTQLPNPLAGLR